MISIVMPYYERQALLDRGLASIRAQYDAEAFDIVICDDGSPTPVQAPGCHVVTLPKKNYALNPCVPLNRAVAAAIGDVLVITNPEIEHRTPVLYEMAKNLGPSDYVMAACQDVSGRWLCASHVRGGEDGRGFIPFGAGFHFCAMLRRELWNRAGGFDEAYRDGAAFDDNDWLMRLVTVGARFIMRDDLVVYHHRAERVEWPSGGWHRNRALFHEKWGLSYAYDR